MRRGIFLVVLAVSFAAVGCAASTVEVIPMGSAPILDGTLSEGEWDDAREIALNDTLSLYLKRADGSIFIGITARSVGVGSPCIVRGEEILVLHASAALGTAVYLEDEGGWRADEDITWGSRRKGFSESAIREREAFFESEGWLATISYPGTPTHFEYRIAAPEGILDVLFLFLEVEPEMVVSWPALPDDTADYLQLAQGYLPETMTFDVDQWARLVLESGD